MGNVKVKGSSGKPKTVVMGQSFAMIELADPKDCNDRKKLWRRSRMADITPAVAKLKKVPSLNGKTALKYSSSIIDPMKSVHADWYLLSGHHGRLYAADSFAFDDNNYMYYNDLDFAGFFNNDYHHHTWSDVARSEPPYGKDPVRLGRVDPVQKKWVQVPTSSVVLGPSEIFLSTTGPIRADAAPFKTANPLQDSSADSARSTKCKGLILAACNTLAFRTARIAWNKHYPNAVFFGTFRTIGYGWWLTNAIRKSRMTGKAFWKNPSSILTSEKEVIELAKQVASKFPRARRDFGMGVMYKGRVYLPRFESGKLRIELFNHDDWLPY